MDLQETSDTIKSLVDNVVKEIIDNDYGFVFKFNTNKLNKYEDNMVEAYKRKAFLNMFDELEQIKNHCLYWFEVEDKTQLTTIVNLLNSYRETKKENNAYRVVPAKALKSYDCSESKVLYVGIRLGDEEKTKQKHSNIAERINQHLGYYKTNTTQGLQLNSYAVGQNTEITLKVFQFLNLGNDYLKLIEKEIARRLNPHCGWH